MPDGFPLPGPVFHEPRFGEDGVTPDPTGFLTDHPSDRDIYAEVETLLKTQVVPVPPSRAQPGDLYSLAAAYGPRGAEVTAAIAKAGRIVFHAIGDSGSTTDGKQYAHELSVADQVTQDCNVPDVANRPAFLFHLGDVVYDFGEAQYYYDQFYAPFRNYPAPIFAIAGNHDSFVVPGTPEGSRPLDTFQRNFCAPAPMVTPEAASLHRTAMTQPGVYFTLDAPFLRIISLFSNALEDPGVISSDGGRWPIADIQLDFLNAQLARIRDEKYAGALLLAAHHPPFSYASERSASGSGTHGCSTAMLRQIDAACKAAGVYPHAVLSGHAHNYQRYTRSLELGRGAIQVPFIVCGDGGHHVNALVRASRGAPAQEPGFGSDVSYLDQTTAVKSLGLRLEKYNDRGYGYLRIDATETSLGIGFHLAGDTTVAQSRYDKVTVDLASHRLVSN